MFKLTKFKAALVALLSTFVVASTVTTSSASAYLHQANANNQCFSDTWPEAAANGMPWQQPQNIAFYRFNDGDVATRIIYYRAQGDYNRIYDCRYAGYDWGSGVRYSFAFRYAPWGNCQCGNFYPYNRF